MLTMVHWRDWAGPEAWRGTDPAAEMFRPFGRVVALHLVVIARFWVIRLSGGARNPVILLGASKLMVDEAVALWQAGFRVRFEPTR